MTSQSPVHAAGGHEAVSLGPWRVKDSAHPLIPTKSIVNLVAGEATLQIERPEGGIVEVPYPQAFVRVDGTKSAKLHTDRGDLYLESRGTSTATQFRAVVDQHHPDQYVAPVRNLEDKLPINWVGVVIGLVIGLGALALSIGSFSSASSVGGSYVVLWGAVLGGGYIVLKSLRIA